MASWSLPCGPLVSSVSHALRRHTVSFSCFLFFFCKSVSTVAQLCLTLCNPMDWSTPGFPVHHQIPKLAKIHGHWVSDVIQPSHPLLFLSLPAFNLSQHQGLFQWVSCLHHVAKLLEFQIQYQSFQWIFRTGFLWDGLSWSPCKPRDSKESSPTPQFKSINSSVLSFRSNSHIHTWLLEKP